MCFLYSAVRGGYQAQGPLTQRKHNWLGIDLKVMGLLSHQAFSKEFAESIGDGALIKNKR